MITRHFAKSSHKTDLEGSHLLHVLLAVFAVSRVGCVDICLPLLEGLGPGDHLKDLGLGELNE
jgi:hypothetical protein